MSDTVIRCEDLVKSFQQGGDRIAILNGVNLSLEKGESMAIIGSSGSGKSTLLNMLGGLDRPDSGRVSLCGQDITALSDRDMSALRNRQLGFVYQMHHLLREFTALENTMMPLLIAGHGRKSAQQQAAALLEQVGLQQRLQHKPSALSGGERQRVAIARAMVANPACVLMDEPTGNLDQGSAQSVLELIQHLQAEHRTAFIVVTHDPRLAATIGAVHRLDRGVLSACADSNE